MVIWLYAHCTAENGIGGKNLQWFHNGNHISRTRHYSIRCIKLLLPVDVLATLQSFA